MEDGIYDQSELYVCHRVRLSNYDRYILLCHLCFWKVSYICNHRFLQQVIVAAGSWFYFAVNPLNCTLCCCGLIITKSKVWSKRSHHDQLMTIKAFLGSILQCITVLSNFSQVAYLLGDLSMRSTSCRRPPDQCSENSVKGVQFISLNLQCALAG